MTLRLSEKQKSVLHFIFWVLIHSFAVGLITLIINNQKITDFWIILGIFGLGITLIAMVIRSLWLKKRFRIGFGLIFWIIVNSIAFWIARDLLIPILSIENVYVPILLTGLILAIIGRVANNIDFGGGHHHSFHLPAIPWWLIIGIIIVAAIFIKIPYAEKPITSQDIFCKDGAVMKQSLGGILGSLPSVGEMQASLSCIEYKSSACNLHCKENNPYCSCQANIWDLILHSPGDWVFR